MLIADLKRFLVSAKRSTYASQGDSASMNPLLPDSKQLEYADGDFLYRDVYVGMFRFVGQEIVYRSGRAVWSMCYSGGLVEGVSHNVAVDGYAFLRKAILAPPPDLPLRGPSCVETGKMRYVCECSGDVSVFRGIETITESGIKIYHLDFAGGLLA